MSLFHAHSIKYKGVSCHPSPVHTYPFLFENGFFFCPVWPSYRPHVFRENAHQSEDFWKRWLLVYLWPDKTEVFECDVYPFLSPEPLGLICNRPLVSRPRDQETTGSGDENGCVPHLPVLLRMLREGCYRIFIVQRFRMDGRKRFE